MLSQIQEAMERLVDLDRRQPLVVGFSGGPDSYCLLDALQRLGYSLVAAHLDHGLRPDSGADVDRVRQIAAGLDVLLVVDRTDASAHAETHGLSVEEAARELRYRFLFQVATERGAQAVAVGHTADDQVETVLMHLLRGAGLAGLKGMRPRTLLPAWSPKIPLIRPLLDLWREQVLAYCQERGLQPLSDPSNLDLSLFRNRLRLELVPYLERYNPGLRGVLMRTSQVLAGDLEVIEKALAEAWDQTVEESGPGYIIFRRAELQGMAVGYQRGLFRKAIERLRPALRDLDFQAIERSLACLNRPPRSGGCDLTAGLRLIFEGERVLLAGWEADLPVWDWPQVEPGRPLVVAAPGDHSLPGGWRLVIQVEADPALARERALANPDPYQVWIDAAVACFPLEVCARQPGDRFLPLGMGGRGMKLAVYFINRKLPRRARGGWPVVRSGEAIIWVPGYQLGHPARLTTETQSALHLRLLRPEEGA